MTHELPYCDELPYWRTSRTSPDGWIVKTIKLLRDLGADSVSDAFVSANDGRATFAIVFTFEGDTFRVVWPVMRIRNPKDESASRIQAATLLYHDCKAKAVSAKALGVRTAFIGQLLLKNGKTVQESQLPILEKMSQLRLTSE